MKIKYILIAGLIVTFLFLGVVFMGKPNSQEGEVTQCSPQAIGVMNLIDLGADYHFVLARLNELRLTYSVWKDGLEVFPLPNSQAPAGPLEILITMDDKKTLGFFVGKRNHIVLDVDVSKKVIGRRCNIVLTGP
jgi:hypothetical protein